MHKIPPLARITRVPELTRPASCSGPGLWKCRVCIAANTDDAERAIGITSARRRIKQALNARLPNLSNPRSEPVRVARVRWVQAPPWFPPRVPGAPAASGNNQPPQTPSHPPLHHTGRYEWPKVKEVGSGRHHAVTPYENIDATPPPRESSGMICNDALAGTSLAAVTAAETAAVVGEDPFAAKVRA